MSSVSSEISNLQFQIPPTREQRLSPALTPPDAAKVFARRTGMQFSVGLLRRRLADGSVAAFRVGKRILIPLFEIERLIAFTFDGVPW